MWQLNDLFQLLEPVTLKYFDKNEIFTLTIILIVWGIGIYLYKRERILSQTEIIALFVFNVLFGTVGDRILAEPPLDFYDTLDYPHGEIFDSILQIFVYPMPIIISIYFYRKFKPNKWFYIVLWASILATLEWISETFFDLYQYNGWTIYYSFVFYGFVMLLNLIFIKKVENLIER